MELCTLLWSLSFTTEMRGVCKFRSPCGTEGVWFKFGESGVLLMRFLFPSFSFGVVPPLPLLLTTDVTPQPPPSFEVAGTDGELSSRARGASTSHVRRFHLSVDQWFFGARRNPRPLCREIGRTDRESRSQARFTVGPPECTSQSGG